MPGAWACRVLFVILLTSIGFPSGPLAADQRAGTTWAEHRSNLQETIREIDSGQMLWVPDGDRLKPVRREDYINALVATVVDPLVRLAYGTDAAFRIPPPEAMSWYRRLAREAVASTEAFKRALVAELENVERYLSSDNSGTVENRVFDPRSFNAVRDHLQAAWALDLRITTRSSEFRPQADVIAKSYGSALEVTKATCTPREATQDFPCVLTGRVIFRGSRDTLSPVVGSAGSMIQDLRMASFTTEAAKGGGIIRFAISASEVGGNLEFSGTLDATTGRMQAGTITWSANRVNEVVGTWSAARRTR